MSHQYPWTRFWSPRSGQIALGNDGYLIDPEDEHGKYFNSSCRVLEDLNSASCLILLGELGMGKSYEMRRYVEKARGVADVRSEQFLEINLANYTTDVKLCSDIFDSTEFKAWASGSGTLNLFLDSLDECLVTVNTLATLLPDQLRKWPIERMRLRIACRPAVWPDCLEKSLTDLWKCVEVCELAPLRKPDVIAALRANRLDENSFLDKAQTLGVTPLAIKPVTLQFLINSFSRHATFKSDSQIDLYWEGCRLLCSEVNESRRVSKRAGKLNEDQRLAVACRIAALTVLANRSAVWIGQDLGDAPEEDVTVRELRDGVESAGVASVVVDAEAVQEALDTGLFSSRGPNRVGWAHRSYQEFLAAGYASKHFDLQQIGSVMFHSGSGQRKLPPQLYGMAGWLALLRADVFDELVAVEPLALLDSDAVTFADTGRKALVDGLLHHASIDKFQPRSEYYGRYQKLGHPALSGQLKPVLCDRSARAAARYLAIEVAEANELTDVGEILVDICLDEQEPTGVRTNAAYALRHVGRTAAVSRLKPVALSPNETDPDDEIKGCALRCLWPDHLTVEELLPALTAPKRQNLTGSYRVFLRSDLVPSLKPADIASALGWIATWPSFQRCLDPFDDVARDLLLRALDHWDLPGVPNALAVAIRSNLRDPKVATALPRDNGQFLSKLRAAGIQRSLVSHLLPLLDDPNEQQHLLLELVSPTDLDWLLEELAAAQTADRREVLAYLVSRVWTIQQIDMVLEACERSEPLARLMAPFRDAVPLDSDRARCMKEAHQERQEQQRMWQPEPPVPLTPAPRERVLAALDLAEAGEPSAWIRVTFELTLTPTSTHYEHDLEWDVTTLPGWNEADEPTRGRLLQAASGFLVQAPSHWNKWLGTNQIWSESVAAYKAFRLIHRLHPESLTHLGHAVWEKWAAVLLFTPLFSEQEERAIHLDLVRGAAEQAPEVFVEPVLVALTKGKAGLDYYGARESLNVCWSQQLGAALMAALRRGRCRASVAGLVIEDLLAHGVVGAQELATNLLRFPVKRRGCRRTRTLGAALALLQQRTQAGWELIEPLLESDESLLVTFSAEATGMPFSSPHWLDKLTEKQLADYYRLLLGRFPYSGDISQGGARAIDSSSRESMQDLRDSVLRRLEGWGTPAAVTELARLRDAHPDLPWLNAVLLGAIRIAAAKTWMAPKPADILALARSRDARFIASGEDLLEVVIEHIMRFEREILHGSTQTTYRLWDGDRPKEEAALSDELDVYLNRELKQKGIVINREIQINRREGRASGDHPDLYVTAVRPGERDFDQIKVAVEAKGNWNPKLFEALKNQLVDKYLKSATCRHGLYAVGWYNCERWYNTDYRAQTASRLDRKETTCQLEEQARQLSRDGIVVRVLILDTAPH